MYAAFGTIAIAQVLMLQNWIVGPAFLLLAIPFYRQRVRREELQLIRHFGDEYREYMSQTNALFPKQEQIDYSLVGDKLNLLTKKIRFFKIKKG